MEILIEVEGSQISGRVEKGLLFGEGSNGGKGFSGGPGRGTQWEGGGTNWRYKKLDLSLFDGSNLYGWILRAERYFNFYRLNEKEKVEAMVVALKGKTLLLGAGEGPSQVPIPFSVSWSTLGTMVSSCSRRVTGRLAHEIH